jgi:hypothetical protein
VIAWQLDVNAVPSHFLAYILTRQPTATVGDWLGGNAFGWEPFVSDCSIPRRNLKIVQVLVTCETPCAGGSADVPLLRLAP